MSIFSFLVNLIPGLVKLAEAAFTWNQAGVNKKKVVMDTALAAAQTYAAVSTGKPVETANAVLTTVVVAEHIDAIVEYEVARMKGMSTAGKVAEVAAKVEKALYIPEHEKPTGRE